MSAEALSTGHLDYLQRTGIGLAALSASTPSTSAPPDLRRLWRIKGVGRIEKQTVPSREPRVRLPSEDVLIGMYGYKIPLAFLIRGEPGAVMLHLGTWSPAGRESAPAKMLDDRQEILKAALNSLYPAIELARAGVELSRLPVAGLALGIPTAKPPDPLDGALPLDRLLRALFGTNWACLVLAEPVDESVTADLRHGVINEMRSVQAAAQAERAPSPLADHYTELLKLVLRTLTSGLEVGVWRTGVYLLGDTQSYYRLASMWRGIFSGDESLPEPVRVWDSPVAAELTGNWAMPDTPGPRGPGHYQHPLHYQTLLTSTQLAAYVHLPQLETSGFTVSAVPHFDAVPPVVKNDSCVRLGKVLLKGNLRERDYEKLPNTYYEIGLNGLTRHAFVAGVTGAGKTNTIFHLLKQTAPKTPFLVIEPAKAEYRGLLKDPDLGGQLQVFTPGNENISRFRLNPLEVVAWPRIPVGVHLDLLRSVFSASFGMWTPLPQILEQCLHAVYQDRGWDIATNNNHRLDGKSDVAEAFPTLSDLAAKADEVIGKLGYEDKITADMRTALLTRINGLCAGGKGRMLDVQRSLPMDALLARPTVLELQDMGDDDDKAFMMGLLLIRLYEYRRAHDEAHGLEHLLVIEEAHRLLTNVGPRRDQETADPRGKAVETFANLLSEIRAYGQGVIIADQVPVKLAPEVIKNTNLKIVHRVVAADDRTVLAGAMAMDEPQARALASFEQGEAAVFSEGDDAPVLVKIKPEKGRDTPDDKQGSGDVRVEKEKGRDTVDDEEVKQHMANSNLVQSNPRVFQPLLPDVDMAKPSVYKALDAARAASNDPTFRRDFVRWVISRTEQEEAPDPLWADLVVRSQRFRLAEMDDDDVMVRALIVYAVRWFAQRRGSQNGWTFTKTGELEDGLRELLFANHEKRDTAHAWNSFRDLMYRLHPRPFEPFPGCNYVCEQPEQVCLYRRAVADYIAAAPEKHAHAFNSAYEADKKGEDERQKTWVECKTAAHELIAHDNAYYNALKRIGLCYAQHMLADRVRPIHDLELEALKAEAEKSANGDQKYE